MDTELSVGAEARLGTAIAECLSTGLLTGPIRRQGYVERAIEPVAVAVFDLASKGELADIGDILTRLDLGGDARRWAAITLEREMESGDSMRQVFAPGGGLLWLNEGLVWAAAFRARWIPFEHYHPDDAKPEAGSLNVRAIAKDLARRGEAIFGYPISAAEAAWATMKGFRVAGVAVSRDAWTSVLEGARAGIREAKAEARYRRRDDARDSSRVHGYLQGVAA
jgi:hypothetical protein